MSNEPTTGEQPANSPLDELMTVEQVAEKLQMRRSTVEDYARRGLLPRIKLGKHVRFRRSEVERAILGLSARDQRDT